MPPTTIVPFGKYKGKPVEALQQDKSYCEWLAGQDWFRTRFTNIHTLIINNFGEPSDTPEHNQLQAKFLDQEWISQFLTLRGGTQINLRESLKYRIEKVITNRQECRERLTAYLAGEEATDLTAGVDHHIASLRACYQSYFDDESFGPGDPVTTKARERLETFIHSRDKDIQDAADAQAVWRDRLRKGVFDCETDLQRWESLDTSALCWDDIDTQFEVKGVDVTVSANLSWMNCAEYEALFARVNPNYGPAFELVTHPQLRGEVSFALTRHFRYRVELKPTLGDDYPAVLRQMRASECDTLVIEDFTACGAGFDQVRAIFDPLVILTAGEIDAANKL